MITHTTRLVPVLLGLEPLEFKASTFTPAHDEHTWSSGRNGLLPAISMIYYATTDGRRAPTHHYSFLPDCLPSEASVPSAPGSRPTPSTAAPPCPASGTGQHRRRFVGHQEYGPRGFMMRVTSPGGRFLLGGSVSHSESPCPPAAPLRGYACPCRPPPQQGAHSAHPPPGCRHDHGHHCWTGRRRRR